MRWSALALLLPVLALGSYGIGRSLWLDEVWVANSVREPSLPGMFYYPHWLQVSPPLFLLLARGSAWILGFSDASLRVVPLLLAMIAVLSLLAAAWRMLSPRFAIFCAAALAFHPTAVEFSRTFKQYSGELAAAASLLLALVLYLEEPTGRRYRWLLASVLVSLPLAYPVVFLAPGIALAVYLAGWRNRAAILAITGAAEFVAVYWIFLRPNLSPDLRAFWAADADSRVTAGLLAALAFCVVAGTRVSWMIMRSKAGWREWTQAACVLPSVLLAISGVAGWYPVSARTRLFLLPGFLLLALTITEDLLRWLFPKPPKWFDIAVTTAIGCMLVMIALPVVWKQFGEDRDRPVENLAGAVLFLQKHVGARDLLLVHPSVREGFVYYGAHGGNPEAVYGDTGWPCCARGKDSRPGISSERAVLHDLHAKIPLHFSGRIWLFYTTRPTHWKYVGLDEGDVWRRSVWESGCPPGPYFEFENLAVSPMECAGPGYTVGEERR